VAFSHRVPLGLLLISRAQITEHQLKEAISKQQGSGSGRIGEWLIRLGFVSEEQVLAALGIQWSCPVMRVDDVHLPDCTRLVPLKLLEHHSIMPVQFVAKTRTLYLGFSVGINHVILYSIEQMLACKARWCALSGMALQSY